MDREKRKTLLVDTGINKKEMVTLLAGPLSQSFNWRFHSISSRMVDIPHKRVLLLKSPDALPKFTMALSLRDEDYSTGWLQMNVLSTGPPEHNAIRPTKKHQCKECYFYFEYK